MSLPDWFNEALQDPGCRSVALLAGLAVAPAGTVRDRCLSELGPGDVELVGVTVMRRDEPDELVLALLGHAVPQVRAAAAVQFRGEHGVHRTDLPEKWLPVWRSAMLSATPRGYGEFELASALSDLAEEDPEAVEEWYQRQLDASNGDSAWQVLGHELHRPLVHLPRANRLSLLQRFREKWWVGSLLQSMVGGDVELVAEAVDGHILTIQQAYHALADLDGAFFEELAPLLLDRGLPAEAAARALDGGYSGSQSQHYGDLLTYCGALASHADGRLAAIGEAGKSIYSTEQTAALSQEHRSRVTGEIWE